MNDLLYYYLCALALGLLGVISYSYIFADFKAEAVRASKPKKDPDKQQRWIPVDYEFPKIALFEGDPLSLPPRAYRAFKSTHHVTMGVRSLDITNWIEIDSQFPYMFKLRQSRLEERGEKVAQILSGAEEAAEELANELAEYLSRRYPTVYKATRRTDSKGWYGEGSISRIDIPCVDASFDFDKDEPIKIIALLIPDDGAIMIEGDDGQYYLRGHTIIVPGFWRGCDKIGMSLSQIHKSGKVPHYAEKLEASMDRYFSRLTVDKPVTRNNYTFTTTGQDDFAWSNSALSNEDDYDASIHGPRKDSEAYKTFRPLEPATDPAVVHLRHERQTLRRLPKTGAIFFTFRSYLDSVPSMVNEPGVPGRMASAIRSWTEEISWYKDGAQYEKALLPYLDEHHAKQVRAGLTSEEVKNSPSFPY